ncbi:MAG: hypothetical protein JNM89_16870 [Hyphomicrobiaceae bacterium]|nr:hypothetical protein [Hyphomicrobiaceae bacterium]
MTAHVAERGEGRGRVVLRLGCVGPVSDVAIDAAIAVAKAFGAGIECLLVEDRQVYDAAAYNFTREIAIEDAGERHMSLDDLARQMALAARATERRVADLAGRAEIPIELRHVRDTPLGALAHACQIAGPWNVVALGEVATSATLARLEMLFDRVTGMTGVVVAGHRSPRQGRAPASVGPVVAVVEDPDRLTGMIRTASRLAGVAGSDVVVALAAQSRSALAWLAENVRQGIGGDRRVTVVELAQPGGGPAVLTEGLRRLRPGFVIAEFGGLAVPVANGGGALAAALDCPLLVVR